MIDLKAAGQACLHSLALACLAAVLSACGGGAHTDGKGTSLHSGPAALSGEQELRISEVATHYYSDDVAWFELYNPSSQPIALQDYTLRSSHLDLDSNVASLVPADFALPEVTVPARGYLVVAGRVFETLKDNSQMVYVRSGRRIPYWNGHGSIELLRTGATVDFVRFGSASAQPSTSDAWRGSPITTLPSGPNEHGRAIVRLHALGMRDTDSSADWSLVNFATPAGPNDVAPDVIDSDADGIPDSAEQPGGTYAGMDLYAMGARAGRRDIFVEIDFMQGEDPALQPREEALLKVKEAFARRGIGLHLDAGASHSSVLDPDRFNLGGGNPVAFAKCVELDTDGNGAVAGCTSFYDIKRSHFDVRRNLVFHYALFAHSLKPDGSSGSSGVAELKGNDLIVSLGGYGLSATPGRNLNMLINLQAGTLMHELGHNLGLRHGGNEDLNYKPNHLSVMNYMYQFAGLSRTPDSIHAAERYYLAAGIRNTSLCNLAENSPCGEDFRIDYSDGRGSPLDENVLIESANIGHGSVAGAYADWDNNRMQTGSALAINLNPQFDNRLSLLRDFNEWGNLHLPFARGRSGNNFGSVRLFSQDSAVRSNPMNHRAMQRIEEEALPSALQETLREMRVERHGRHQHEKQ